MIATTQQNMTTELDLGSSDGPPRNWKGIGIALVVIMAVMSLVILSVVLLTPDESHLLLRSHLTMEDLERAEFKVHDPCVSWLSESEVVLRTREGHVLSFSLSSNLTTALLDNSSLLDKVPRRSERGDFQVEKEKLYRRRELKKKAVCAHFPPDWLLCVLSTRALRKRIFQAGGSF